MSRYLCWRCYTQFDGIKAKVCPKCVNCTLIMKIIEDITKVKQE